MPYKSSDKRESQRAREKHADENRSRRGDGPDFRMLARVARGRLAGRATRLSVHCPATTRATMPCPATTLGWEVRRSIRQTPGVMLSGGPPCDPLVALSQAVTRAISATNG
jgi:hypothetical protein